MDSKFLLLLLLGSFGLSLGAVLPPYMKVCSRNDPKLGQCIKNVVHNLRPYLKNGIKELNMPSMEPLHIGNLNILENGAGGLNVKAKNLDIYGASDFEIKRIKATDGGKRLNFELSLPHLHGIGEYSINGKLLGIPLKGDGPFTGNFTNFYAYVTLGLEVKPASGIDYVSVKELKVRIRTGSGNIQLENLLNGDALGVIINETINQNFEAVVEELIDPIAKALEKNFHAATQKIMDNFTYDELLPE